VQLYVAVMVTLANAPRKLDQIKLREIRSLQKQNRSSAPVLVQNQQSLLVETKSRHRDLGSCRTELKTCFKLTGVLHFGVSFVKVPDLELSWVNCQNESFWLQSFFGYKSVFPAFLRQHSLVDNRVKKKEIKTGLKLPVCFQSKN